jgi:hypothetical protein
MRILLFILTALIFAGSASAGQNDRVQLRVSGFVAPKCDVKIAQTSHKLELETKVSSTARIPLDINCNTPFKVNLEAQNGRLKLQDKTGRQHRLVPTSVPYEARLRLPVRSPKPRIIRRNFKGENLVSGRSVSTGNGISAGRAQLVLKTIPQPRRFYAAGTYKEVIKVSVTPL